MGIDFDENPVAPIPAKLGLTVIDSVSLEDIVPFIDWNPFFQTWELRGRYPNRGYPKIFNDETGGAEAKKLFDDAQAMLKKIVETKELSLKGCYGLYAANRSEGGEDVDVWENESDRNGKPAAMFCMLRQQAEVDGQQHYLSQADFVTPRGSGPPGHVRRGLFRGRGRRETPRGRERRLFEDHGPGLGRSPRRGLRREIT